MKPLLTSAPEPLRIGIVDTGVNPWHSHVRGAVSGMRIFLDAGGRIREDEDFRDLVGHGTAVAGILRQGLPDAELFVVRVFDETLDSYPSLVARALLRAAAEGCRIINLSLGMSPGPGGEVLAEACRAVQEAGSVLVAAGHPGKAGLLPASLPGVTGVVAADHLKPGEITVNPGKPYSHEASGWPRDLDGLPPGANLWGNSFACARVTLDLALKMETGSTINTVHGRF
ncbi:S8 family serine peptidase [Desulfuromonas sp. TF]|uniref:S8 family peptidase n=1 Tax=Desulfuromonas sp. TF TaxID=1232410 RepID=UPI0003F9E6A6|nr:S8 family serine peptidase [Desulfuromonas sp. TF]